MRRGETLLWWIAAALLLSAAGDVAAKDRRSTERLRYSCESSIAERDITLFANGTIRLRQGPPQSQEMILIELDPKELVVVERELAQIWHLRQEGEVEGPQRHPLGGAWGEVCELDLALVGQEEPFHYSFAAFEVRPMVVARLVQFIEGLVLDAEPAPPVDRVAADYEPSYGDVLVTVEGYRYRVVRRTADGQGVELEGLDQPTTLIVALDNLPTAFVAVEDGDP